MTISFFEQGDVPQPPDKVKIELIEAEPLPELWRVKANIHVTPFQKRPSLEVALFRKLDDGNEIIVANASVIETMHPKMEFFLHIRHVDHPVGDYILRAALFFREVEEDTTTEELDPMKPTDVQGFEFAIRETDAETSEQNDS